MPDPIPVTSPKKSKASWKFWKGSVLKNSSNRKSLQQQPVARKSTKNVSNTTKLAMTRTKSNSIDSTSNSTVVTPSVSCNASESNIITNSKSSSLYKKEKPSNNNTSTSHDTKCGPSLEPVRCHNNEESEEISLTMISQTDVRNEVEESSARDKLEHSHQIYARPENKEKPNDNLEKLETKAVMSTNNLIDSPSDNFKISPSLKNDVLNPTTTTSSNLSNHAISTDVPLEEICLQIIEEFETVCQSPKPESRIAEDLPYATSVSNENQKANFQQSASSVVKPISNPIDNTIDSSDNVSSLDYDALPMTSSDSNNFAKSTDLPLEEVCLQIIEDFTLLNEATESVPQSNFVNSHDIGENIEADFSKQNEYKICTDETELAVRGEPSSNVRRNADLQQQSILRTVKSTSALESSCSDNEMFVPRLNASESNVAINFTLNDSVAPVVTPLNEEVYLITRPAGSEPTLKMLSSQSIESSLEATKNTWFDSTAEEVKSLVEDIQESVELQPSVSERNESRETVSQQTGSNFDTSASSLTDGTRNGSKVFTCFNYDDVHANTMTSSTLNAPVKHTDGLSVHVYPQLVDDAETMRQAVESKPKLGVDDVRSGAEAAPKSILTDLDQEAATIGKNEYQEISQQQTSTKVDELIHSSVNSPKDNDISHFGASESVLKTNLKPNDPTVGMDMLLNEDAEEEALIRSVQIEPMCEPVSFQNDESKQKDDFKKTKFEFMAEEVKSVTGNLAEKQEKGRRTSQRIEYQNNECHQNANHPEQLQVDTDCSTRNVINNTQNSTKAVSSSRYDTLVCNATADFDLSEATTSMELENVKCKSLSQMENEITKLQRSEFNRSVEELQSKSEDMVVVSPGGNNVIGLDKEQVKAEIILDKLEAGISVGLKSPMEDVCLVANEFPSTVDKRKPLIGGGAVEKVDLDVIGLNATDKHLNAQPKEQRIFQFLWAAVAIVAVLDIALSRNKSVKK